MFSYINGQHVCSNLLQHVILDRRSRQDQSVVTVQLLHCLRNLINFDCKDST